MIKVYIFYILAFLPVLIYGQDGSTNQAQVAIEQFRQGSALVNAFDNRYEGVKGTPFYADEWLPGRLEVAGAKDLISGVHLQLDVFNQEIYVRPDAMHSFFKMENEIRSFQLVQNGDTLLFYRVNADDINQSLHKNYYLKSVWQGHHLALYQLPFKILHKADYQGAYATGDRFDEFQPGDMWFLFDGKDYQKVKLNAKALVKLFPDLKSDLKNREITTEQDFIDVLQWIDLQLH